MKNVNENAKVDWMNLVKKHKKKQRGLPALSTLNTNAGNVEKNIELFNMMQPDGNAVIDASNGNVSSSECCAMGESITHLVEEKKPTFILTYTDLPVNVVRRAGSAYGHYDSSYGAWVPDDDDLTEIAVDWKYELTLTDVIEALQENVDVMLDLGIDPDAVGFEVNKVLADNAEYLVEKYADVLKDYFYKYAINDAQEHYDYLDSMSYHDASLTENRTNGALDDNFDMSMRTLL